VCASSHALDAPRISLTIGARERSVVGEPPRGEFSEGYSFDHSHRIATELEALLYSYGISIRPGSALEQATLSIFDILYHRDAERDTADIRPLFRDLVGLTELGALLLAVRHHASFPSTLPHLRLLNAGNALQNAPASQLDQAANKIFELFAATLAMRCGTSVELENPSGPGSNNPDVLVTMSGRRWGIACKVLHSENPESFLQNFEKGIDQIERSAADVGVVLFNLKNIIRHQDYWTITNVDEWRRGGQPRFSAFRDPQRPFNQLLRETQHLAARVRDYVGLEYLRSAVAGKRTIPGFLLWSHTLAGVVIDEMPKVTSVRIMNFQRIHALTGDETAIVNCLHDAAFADQR
jgi:hypothetical protein